MATVLPYYDFQARCNHDFSFLMITIYLLLLSLGLYSLHGNLLDLSYKFQELETICSS